MKSKLPIIRAALEAGLRLEFTMDEMNELKVAVEMSETSEWEDIEKYLPCVCVYSAGRFYLQGIEKKEGAGKAASENDAMAFVRAFMKWAKTDGDEEEGTAGWLIENLVPMADKILANSGEGSES
jgi:hypothetical protein